MGCWLMASTKEGAAGLIMRLARQRRSSFGESRSEERVRWSSRTIAQQPTNEQSPSVTSG